MSAKTSGACLRYGVSLQHKLWLGTVLFSISCTGLFAQNLPHDNPLIGTWRLNLELSRFESGPALKNQTRQYTERFDGFIVVNVWSMDAHGNPSFTQSVCKYDIKNSGEYEKTDLESFQATAADRGHGTFTIVNTSAVDMTNKIDGRVAIASIRTISRDRKTMTHVLKGIDAQGKPYTNTLIFDRVR